MEAYSFSTGRPRQRNTPSPCLFPGLAPLLLFGLLFGTGLAADRRDITSSPEISTESADALPETVQSRNEATEIAVETVANGNQNTDRTELNLLGEVDTESGESRRNENVQLTLVDNNVLKELNIRMGTSATIIREFEASNGYFGAEFGNPPVRQFHLAPANKSGFHGSIYEVHSNSQFQARSFFQVGGVKPARSNDYGLNILLPLGASTSLTVDANQRRTRGNVNGKRIGSASRGTHATDYRSHTSRLRLPDPGFLPGNTAQPYRYQPKSSQHKRTADNQQRHHWWQAGFDGRRQESTLC